ncbi:hypothetical protein SAMN03159343_1436 [Klenkia marina]|uniref:Uncharacterized protein n=1 Tax=Klenkia marina TaxID=1960309 RepID=A0A1G4XTM5_9ACTN|nr:hypothetical protein [Klenkia marina]SCX44552.1 hypothetical protein SAMN03159343_1436 [Klenkia marina]
MTDPQHPRTEQFPPATPPSDPAVHTQAQPYAGDAPVEEAPHTRRRSGKARVALVAAAAVGLAAVGGGGFAVGRATAPDTATSSTTDQEFPGGGRFGTPPGDGQLVTPPDGDQFGTPPGQDGTTDGITTDGTTTDGATSEPTT